MKPWEKSGKKSPTYQMGRRRWTYIPGYHSVLPRTFPCFATVSLEEAEQCISWLVEVGRSDFAVTSHPHTIDGHVSLWLSFDNADFLMERDVLRLVYESEIR